MTEPVVLWPTVAGILFLVLGLITARAQLSSGKLLALGPVFVAASLAAFGLEHLVGAKMIMGVVPSWMPAKLFWTYLVGTALVAVGASIAMKRLVRLSATLLGTMILLFVLLIHLPNVIASPKQTLLWAILLRDLSFSGGAWILAGGRFGGIGRLWIAVAALFFAALYFLHPDITPGVPLNKLMPAWVPARPLWGYLQGALFLFTGIAVLAKRYARLASTWLGAAVTLSVILVYIPVMALNPTLEAVNYVFDTLLFAGTIWVLAQASH